MPPKRKSKKRAAEAGSPTTSPAGSPTKKPLASASSEGQNDGEGTSNAAAPSPVKVNEKLASKTAVQVVAADRAKTAAAAAAAAEKADLASNSYSLSLTRATYQPAPPDVPPVGDLEPHIFSSFTRAELKDITSCWHCANPDCKEASKDKGGFGRMASKGRFRGAFALLCGHYLCHSCLAPHIAPGNMDGLSCPHRRKKGPVCGFANKRDSLLAAPRVRHVEVMIEMMIKPGVSCTKCPLTDVSKKYYKTQTDSERQPPYPAKMMTVCDAVHSRISCTAKSALVMCVFCAMAHDREYHRNNDYSLRPVDKNDRKNIATAGPLAKERHPWHLYYLPEADMIKVSEKFLQCGRCGYNYCNEESVHLPRILDCGHLICSECATANVKLKNKAERKKTACAVKGCPAPMSKFTRKVPELNWLAERKTRQRNYRPCELCEMGHSTELCAPHRNDIGERWKACESNICLYCVNKDTFMHNHRHK